MSILSARYSSKQVVDATGLPNATLQTWLKRSLVVGHRQIAGGGSQGVRRHYSFFNVMELAIAHQLVGLGLSASMALASAQRFAHGGNDGRRPGVPFDSRSVGCRTLLCVYGDRSFAYRMTEANNAFYAEARHRLGSSDFVVIDISALFERVMRGLGLDYRDVLAAAYDETAN